MPSWKISSGHRSTTQDSELPPQKRSRLTRVYQRAVTHHSSTFPPPSTLSSSPWNAPDHSPSSQDSWSHSFDYLHVKSNLLICPVTFIFITSRPLKNLHLISQLIPHLNLRRNFQVKFRGPLASGMTTNGPSGLLRKPIRQVLILLLLVAQACRLAFPRAERALSVCQSERGREPLG